MAGRRQHGEGSLYYRSDRRQWVAVADLGWRGGQRDRREFTGPTSAAARGKRDEFLAKRRDGFTMPKGRPPYVEEWMTHWLHNIARPSVEASTWNRSYRQKTEDLIIPFFERVPLPELDEEMIEAWHRQLERRVSERTGRRMAPATITQAHRILSVALNVAVVRKKMQRNPASNVTPPAIRRPPMRVPREKDAARILDRCATWPTGPRWIIALTTAMRQGEVLGLTWPYVELDDDPGVRVELVLSHLPWEHGCEDEGCGRRAAWCRERRDGGPVLKAPKSETSKRWIALGALGLAALQRQWESQMAAKLEAGSAWGWSGGDLAFAGYLGRPVDPRKDWQDWQDLLADLRLPGYRVHDARHAVATLLLEQGVDVKVVQELLGHSSAAVTQEFYQHVRRKLKRDAATVLDRVLGA
jgi:integrase